MKKKPIKNKINKKKYTVTEMIWGLIQYHSSTESFTSSLDIEPFKEDVKTFDYLMTRIDEGLKR